MVEKPVPPQPAAAHPRGHALMPYWRLAAMVGVSMLAMYAVMYLNTSELAHVYFSETRVFMTILMGCTMTVIMVAFMRSMYPLRQLNAFVLGGASALFLVSLWLVRSQSTIGDVAWMKAMIPHHSIAILTSEHARIVDPRVRVLADSIIAAQRREIGEMQQLIKSLEAR